LGCNLYLTGRKVEQFCLLVVDDETRIVKFLKLRLEASGYEVLTANSGLEALKILKAREPDLLVRDVLMPGMDGLETLDAWYSGLNHMILPHDITSFKIEYDKV
jgi:CheY-like chemotaxis protein